MKSSNNGGNITPNQSDIKKAEEYFKQGNNCYRQGKTKEAIECYDKAIQFNPNEADAYYNKGIALYGLGKKVEAIECFDKVIHLKPNYATAYHNKGLALSDLGKNIKAIKCYDMSIKLNPNDANAYLNKGNTLFGLGKQVEAIECYDIAIKFNPNNANAYSNKGSALYVLGKNVEAIEFYDKVIKLNPNYAETYNSKGNALSMLGKKLEAIECFDKAIQLNPNYAEAYSNKGSALYALGKYIESIEYYDKVIKLDPYSAATYNNKGSALDALGEKVEAIKCFEQAIKLDPNLAQAYSNKGNVLSALGKKLDAIKCYDEAIKLDPYYVLCYCSKGKALNGLGKQQEALACFNKAYEISRTGNLGNYLTKDNISYINDTLSKDREDLLKKLTELQKSTTEAARVVDGLNPGNPLVKKVVEKFKSLEQINNVAINQAIDELDPSKSKEGQISTINRRESVIISSKQMGELQAQMEAFKEEILTAIKKDITMLKQGQDAIYTELKGGFNEVKEEQKKQAAERTKKIDKYGKQIEAQSKMMEDVQKTANELKDKLKADTRVNQKDKERIEQSIKAITEKMQGLANKDDVEAIAQEMTKLMGEARITKGRLIDIEDDIDNLIEQQGKVDERLVKLELFQKSSEELREKIQSDTKINQKDKERMEQSIKAITEKMQSLANKDDVETITQEMIKLMSEARITKGRLADIEDDIDNLLENQSKVDDLSKAEGIGSDNNAKVYKINNIAYDNKLLNHLELFKDALGMYGLNQAINLSSGLSNGLIDEAITHNDASLIMGGLMSLDFN